MKRTGESGGWAGRPFALSLAAKDAEALCVERTVTQMPKGPYREVLDWLVDQIERLEEHRAQLAEEAARGELDPQTVAARQAAIAQAHDWLADQLRQALLVRGMHLAA